MLVVSIGLVIPQILKQWEVKYPAMLVTALYAGSLVGAILCGFGIDYLGRKIVWQSSLFVVTIFTMLAAASPNFAALAIFIGFQTIGAGGNREYFGLFKYSQLITLQLPLISPSSLSLCLRVKHTFFVL